MALNASSSKQNVDYNDLAEIIDNQETLQFLRGMYSFVICYCNNETASDFFIISWRIISIKALHVGRYRALGLTHIAMVQDGATLSIQLVFFIIPSTITGKKYFMMRTPIFYFHPINLSSTYTLHPLLQSLHCIVLYLLYCI